MARQTRSQRRARRRQQAEAAAVVERAPTRQQQQVRPAAVEQPKTQIGVRRAPGAGGRRFVGESWAELKKVEWPGQRQVITGTVVVLIACAIVGTYLWVADLALKRVVQNVFLGQ
ncbi:MAG: preprotein translocase subunit SecE [Actinomycetota bacterium]|nr:preprotein translocase subunit SecE [Actinomycetota bacterium]